VTEVRYYVCDRCGHLWRQPSEPLEWRNCHRCGHTAIWEFPKAQAARDHAATIKTIRQ